MRFQQGDVETAARALRAAVANALPAVKDTADLITSWFPFVTPAAILAWRLPLSLLALQGDKTKRMGVTLVGRMVFAVYDNGAATGVVVAVVPLSARVAPT